MNIHSTPMTLYIIRHWYDARNFTSSCLLAAPQWRCMTGWHFTFFARVTLTLTRWPSYTNMTSMPWRSTGWAKMNFVRQGFQKLSSDRQTDTTEIITTAASRVVTVVINQRSTWDGLDAWNYSQCGISCLSSGLYVFLLRLAILWASRCSRYSSKTDD